MIQEEYKTLNESDEKKVTKDGMKLFFDGVVYLFRNKHGQSTSFTDTELNTLVTMYHQINQ